MTIIKENRLANLKALADEIGVPELAKRMGYNQPSYLYQILNQTAIQNGKPKNIGSNMARKIEMAMGKKEGWLDLSHSTNHISDKSVNIGKLTNVVNGGNQTNIAGDQNTNNFFNSETTEKEAKAILGDKKAQFLSAMPLLDIDDGVAYAINPEHKKEQITNNSQRLVSFIPSSDRTFAVKIAAPVLRGVTDTPLIQNDILIIEPLIPPRNQDVVLICLNYQQPNQRGIIARLSMDLHDNVMIKYSEADAEPLPANALICGVVVEVKRQLLPSDSALSRVDAAWDILNTLQTK